MSGVDKCREAFERKFADKPDFDFNSLHDCLEGGNPYSDYETNFAFQGFQAAYAMPRVGVDKPSPSNPCPSCERGPLGAWCSRKPGCYLFLGSQDTACAVKKYKCPACKDTGKISWTDYSNGQGFDIEREDDCEHCEPLTDEGDGI